MSQPPFRELDHTADLALWVHGRDLATLYLHAALGLAHLLGCSSAVPVTGVAPVEVSLSAPDAETLMVDWMSELLYLVEVHGRCPVVASLHLDEPVRMTAMVVLSDECARATVKAATYADMAIRHTADGWETTVTFDA